MFRPNCDRPLTLQHHMHQSEIKKAPRRLSALTLRISQKKKKEKKWGADRALFLVTVTQLSDAAWELPPQYHT